MKVTQNQIAGRSGQIQPPLPPKIVPSYSEKSEERDSRNLDGATASYGLANGNEAGHPVRKPKKKGAGVKLGRTVGHFPPKPQSKPKGVRAHEKLRESCKDENPCNQNLTKHLPGFSELFQPSQSSSIETEARANYVEVMKHKLGHETNDFLY